MDPKAKFRSLSTRRSTTGFGVYNSQPMVAQNATPASEADPMMKLEPNQSASSPRSSVI